MTNWPITTVSIRDSRLSICSMIPSRRPIRPSWFVLSVGMISIHSFGGNSLCGTSGLNLKYPLTSSNFVSTLSKDPRISRSFSLISARRLPISVLKLPISVLKPPVSILNSSRNVPISALSSSFIEPNETCKYISTETRAITDVKTAPWRCHQLDSDMLFSSHALRHTPTMSEVPFILSRGMALNLVNKKRNLSVPSSCPCHPGLVVWKSAG